MKGLKDVKWRNIPTKKLKALVKEEFETADYYNSLGLVHMARDERSHGKFFEKLLTEVK